MLKFEDIHEDVVKVLKANDIKEADLYNHYSDLYIGCKNHATASKILNAGVWRSMSSIFTPNKGSDMDQYPVAVDIAFAYVGQFQREMAKRKK